MWDENEVKWKEKNVNWSFFFKLTYRIKDIIVKNGQ